MGEVYQLTGRYKETEKLLQESLSINDMLGKASKYFLLGRIYFEREEYDEAMRFTKEAQLLDQKYESAFWLSGMIHLTQNRIQEAENELNRIFQIDPNCAKYYHLLGEINLSKGEFGMAIRELSKPIEMIYGFSGTYSEHLEFYREALARAYFQSGDLERAIDECMGILKDNPNWAGAHYLLGQVYEKKGNPNKAIDAYRDFLDVWHGADGELPKIISSQQRISILK